MFGDLARVYLVKRVAEGVAAKLLLNRLLDIIKDSIISL